ncbi:T7SS effector LXG polymorphic toxin [Ligilactobacillus sp. LYQ139]|uniref:T7SS effector LXG polymorphic toxin n=1 Tax=Ligilactobacillus sp. LYQ139 TaxID=3378800 RepID=UPI0038548123
MGKRFDLGASQAQASSCQQACTELGNNIQQISATVAQAASSDISGMGGTHVKDYAEAVVVPMLQAAVMLSEAVKQGTTQLPQQYIAKVDSKSHSEDELQEEVASAKGEISMIDDMQKALNKIDKSAGDKFADATKGVRTDAQARLQKAEQILQHFRNYDGESGALFGDIDKLSAAFDQGTHVMQSVTVVNGVFGIPVDLEWAEYISDRWSEFAYNVIKNRSEVEDKLDDAASLFAAFGKDVVKKGKVFHARELYRVADKVGKGADIFQYITSAFDFRRNFKKTRDFGVSLMKDFGGVGVSAVTAKLLSGLSDPVGAFISIGLGEVYNMAYKHYPPFRHTMNNIGHAVDVLGKEIEAEPKESKKELHEERQVTNRMSPKLDSGTAHDIKEERQINNDMVRGFN